MTDAYTPVNVLILNPVTISYSRSSLVRVLTNMYLQQHSQVIKNLDRRLHEQQSHHKSTEDVQAVTRQPYETQRRIVDLAENEYVTQMHQNVEKQRRDEPSGTTLPRGLTSMIVFMHCPVAVSHTRQRASKLQETRNVLSRLKSNAVTGSECASRTCNVSPVRTSQIRMVSS